MIDTSKIEEHFRSLMTEGLGLDLSDPNLIGTPERVARMYATFFAGMNSDFDGLTKFPNEDDGIIERYDEIVLLDNIFFVSMCSHHFLPFTGYAWVAYIPDQEVMGASKASRVISHYAARPQLQERLGNEIANRINEILKPISLMVIMRAAHGCMKCRGVRQYNNSGMVTSAIRGNFRKDPASKAEALELIKISMGTFV